MPSLRIVLRPFFKTEHVSLIKFRHHSYAGHIASALN